MKRKKGKGKVVRQPRDQKLVAKPAAPVVPPAKPPVDMAKYRNQVYKVDILPAALEFFAARSLPPEVVSTLKPRMTDATCDHKNGIPILTVYYRLEDLNGNKAQPAASSPGPKSTQ